ncbi:MAG: hypothetical protein NC320_12065 [Clostridium sp.]|nr:hypothetical protein [Clostridium sp.]MCM1548266.1 hypothetical protein [Ruminococcus sp.]
MKRIKAILAAALMLLVSCSPKPDNTSDDSRASSLADVLETMPEEEEESVSYTEYIADVPKIENEDTSIKFEAEDFKPAGSLFAADDREGYSGTGYVTGFYGGSDDYVNLLANLDANQHYDITICVAADSETTTSIAVNGNDLQDFSIKGTGSFTKITFYGIYMNKGENLIVVRSGTANFDLDYIEITNNESIYDTKFKIDNSASDDNISPEADALLKNLKASFGKNIITGQYVSSEENTELEFIHKITGKYPMIRFSDIGGYSDNGAPLYPIEVDAALKWAQKGGMVGFMWYWNSPDELTSSVYSKETDFSLKSAVTKIDIAAKPISEIEELYDSGRITLECLNLVKDIDAVSNALLVLSDEKVPVLWRPLHEAGGDWYWWGTDGIKAYNWLYELMYKRMTEYHKLNNLIWIWNGQSEEYMVDSDMYDIAAIDIYMPPESYYGSRSEQYQWLKSITESGKLLAISECSSVPDIDEMLRDNSLWSFFGLWFGEYIMDSNGNLSEIYTKKNDLIKIYNAGNSVTLDTVT